MKSIYSIDKCVEILRLEKIDLVSSDDSKKTNFQLNGIYTLGLLSNPKFVTVANQQERAYVFAQAINALRLGQKKQQLSIAIIGGGFSGISLALMLENFNEPGKKATFRVKVLERGSQLCHLQRMCTIRRLHPNVHKWPLQHWESDYFLKGNIKSQKKLSKNTINGQINWEASTAARVASLFSESIISKINPKYKGLEIFLSCFDILINKRKTKFDISVNGAKVLDDKGNKSSIACLKSGIDIIVIATGFGVEKGIFSSTAGLGNQSYWRNDSVGQTNLYQNSETYLISGNGDGGVVDLLRLIIEDFSQDETLEALLPTKITKQDKNDSRIKDYLIFIKELKKKKLNNGEVFEWLEHYFGNLKTNFNDKNGKKVYEYIAERIMPKIKENVSCVFLIKISEENNTNKVKAVIDNKNITFYNRVLFYFVWAFGNVEVVTSYKDIETAEDLFQFSTKYNVPHKNIIIRHGVEVLSPLNLFLHEAGVIVSKDSVLSKYEMNSRDDLLSKTQNDFRLGKRYDEILL